MKNPELNESLNATYTESFFEQHDNSFYGVLAEAILKICGPTVKSALDVGCGHGFLVEAFRALNIQSYGLEGSESAEKMWPEKSRHFYVIKDLTQSGVASHTIKTDIVCTFEVAEHLPSECANSFINLLTHHLPRHIIFGAATPYQDLDKNPTHVNEQSFNYWIKMFSSHGYTLELLKTIQLKESLFEGKRTKGIRWWYPKNAMVFVPEGSNKYSKEHDLELARIESDKLQWRIRSKNPVFNLVADRDYYEYISIVESEISAAKTRIADNRYV